MLTFNLESNKKKKNTNVNLSKINIEKGFEKCVKQNFKHKKIV